MFLNRSICAAFIPGLVAQDDDVSSRFTASGSITAGCDWDCVQPITSATGIGLASAPVRPLAVLKTSTWEVSSHHPRPRGRFLMDVSQFVNLLKKHVPLRACFRICQMAKSRAAALRCPSRTARCPGVKINVICSNWKHPTVVTWSFRPRLLNACDSLKCWSQRVFITGVRNASCS